MEMSLLFILILNSDEKEKSNFIHLFCVVRSQPTLPRFNWSLLLFTFHRIKSTREAFQAVPFQGNINIYLGFLHLVLQCVEKMHKLVNYSLQQLVTRKSE